MLISRPASSAVALMTAPQTPHELGSPPFSAAAVAPQEGQGASTTLSFLKRLKPRGTETTRRTPVRKRVLRAPKRKEPRGEKKKRVMRRGGRSWEIRGLEDFGGGSSGRRRRERRIEI